MYVVSGVIVDRWGTRIGLGAFMVWWSVANMLHGFVNSGFAAWSLSIFAGAGESGNFMAATKATSEWFPAKERAFVNGLVNAGAAVGAIVSGPMIVWLYLRYGWRSTLRHHRRARPDMDVCVAVSLLSAAAPSPNNDGGTGAHRRRMTPFRLSRKKIRWRELLQVRQTWGLFLARFLSSPVWWFYLFWLPKYLVEQRGFTMQQMGMLVWLPYLCADLGSIFRRPALGLSDQTKSGSLACSPIVHAALRDGDAAQPADSVHSIHNRRNDRHLRCDVQPHGVDDEPDDGHQRHLSAAGGRLGRRIAAFGNGLGGAFSPG